MNPTRERGRLARMLSLAVGNAPVSGLAPERRCCRRLRGSTLMATLLHGLTPTATCWRRIRGLTLLMRRFPSADAAVHEGTLLLLPNGEASRHLQLHQRGELLTPLRGCPEPRAAAREMILSIRIPRPSSVLTWHQGTPGRQVSWHRRAGREFGAPFPTPILFQKHAIGSNENVPSMQCRDFRESRECGGWRGLGETRSPTGLPYRAA